MLIIFYNCYVIFFHVRRVSHTCRFLEYVRKIHIPIPVGYRTLMVKASTAVRVVPGSNPHRAIGQYLLVNNC